MPRKKKTEIAEAAAEVVTEAVKAPVAETPEVKPEKKTAEKKTDDKKAPAKAAKKAPAKAAKAEKPAVKQTVKIQFEGEEFDINDIQKAVEADIKSKFKGKIKTVEAYIKPEDKAVYYVVNSDFSDKVGL